MSAHRKRVLFGTRRLSLKQVQVLVALTAARGRLVSARDIAYLTKRRLDDVHEAIARMRDLIVEPMGPGKYAITIAGQELLRL